MIESIVAGGWRFPFRLIKRDKYDFSTSLETLMKPLVFFFFQHFQSTICCEQELRGELSWSHQTHTQPRFGLHRKKIRLPLLSLKCWLQGPQGSKYSDSLAKMTLYLHIILLLYAILLYTLLYLLMCVRVCI